MRNRYGGKCYRCGLWVAPGAGHFEKVRGQRPAMWLTQHAECAISNRGSADGRTKAVEQAAASRFFAEGLEIAQNAQNEHPTRPILTDNDMQTDPVKSGRSE